jgi:MtN3 and saliva related transmembrane protein
MMNPEVVGFIAAVLTTAAFIPQFVRIWQTRSTRDLSWTMTGLFTFGVGLWLVYGVLMGAFAIIVANAITFSLWIGIAVMKWRFERHNQAR